VGDNIAGERARWRLAEDDLGGQGAIEIFVDDGSHPISRVFLQGCAGIHLVAGNPNIHKLLVLPSGDENHEPDRGLLPLQLAQIGLSIPAMNAR